jgi:hypothetical protein
MNDLEKIPTGPQPPMPNELQPPAPADVWPQRASGIGDWVAKVGANNPESEPMPTIENDLPTQERFVPVKGVQGYRDDLAARVGRDAAESANNDNLNPYRDPSRPNKTSEDVRQDTAAAVERQRSRHFRRGAALLGKAAAGVAAVGVLVGGVANNHSDSMPKQGTPASTEQIQENSEAVTPKPETSLPGPTEIPTYKTGQSTPR